MPGGASGVYLHKALMEHWIGDTISLRSPHLRHKSIEIWEQGMHNIREPVSIMHHLFMPQ